MTQRNAILLLAAALLVSIGIQCNTQQDIHAAGGLEPSARYFDACGAFLAEVRAGQTLINGDPARYKACKRRAEHWLAVMEQLGP